MYGYYGILTDGKRKPKKKIDSKGSANGVVFLAVVHSLGVMPESEMKEIGFFEAIPDELTYPNVSPLFFREAEKFLWSKQ